MKSPIKKVVIVGGGSAGWMSAALLSKRFTHFDITLIESPDVPIIGVGESTLGGINLFLSLLELQDSDWMEYCNATYKMAIKFRNFYKKGEEFYYPFGLKDTQNTINGLNDWYMKKTIHPETPVCDFYDSFYWTMPLIYNNKIIDNTENKIPSFSFQNDAAYHMDATLFGEFLKEKVCLPNGVRYINEHIETIDVTNENHIEFLKLKTGEIIHADLYLDCTGFKSLLLEKSLGVNFQSFSDVLPNNKAWVTHIPYTNKEQEIENVTNCTAIENGWVWNIPLYNRIGSGYVFCDKFVTEEEALAEYKTYLDSDQMNYPKNTRSSSLQFRMIDIKNGIHDVCWKNNVIAVGLSYGFIEPLESTGLFSVQEILFKLCEVLEQEQVNRIHKDQFNYQITKTMQSFKYFVAYHYTFSARRDTKYWQYITEEVVMDPILTDHTFYNLVTPVSTFANKLMSTHNINADEGGISDIFVGMHMFPMNNLALDWHTYLKLVETNKLPVVYKKSTQDYWNYKKSYVENLTKSLLSHYQYLKKYIYNNTE
jgi:tryptophan halogenase